MALIMMRITFTLLPVIMIDGCPVRTSVTGSCCETKGMNFKFSNTAEKSHVYNITNFCGDCELVAEGYCDAVTNGGGWLVIQRRQDGSVDFHRNWVDYEDGFGSLTGEFWYGLLAIHCLTNQGQWELRVDYMSINGTNGNLSYSNFRVGPAVEQYKLTISGFNGVADDPFSTSALNGMKFTTKDKDNDLQNKNCAVYDGFDDGGWWYNSCSHIYLNTEYKNQYGIYLNKKWISLNFVEMKIRPVQCE